MKRFSLSYFELFLVYGTILLFIYSSAIVIRGHYDVVKGAYDITKLKKSVSRSQEIIETLKVQRAKIVAPEFLEQVAGRGGYTQPKQEQIILLNHKRIDP